MLSLRGARAFRNELCGARDPAARNASDVRPRRTETAGPTPFARNGPDARPASRRSARRTRHRPRALRKRCRDRDRALRLSATEASPPRRRADAREFARLSPSSPDLSTGEPFGAFGVDAGRAQTSSERSLPQMSDAGRSDSRPPSKTGSPTPPQTGRPSLLRARAAPSIATALKPRGSRSGGGARRGASPRAASGRRPSATRRARSRRSGRTRRRASRAARRGPRRRGRRATAGSGRRRRRCSPTASTAAIRSRPRGRPGSRTSAPGGGPSPATAATPGRRRGSGAARRRPRSRRRPRGPRRSGRGRSTSYVVHQALSLPRT